jgi:D-alanyl-D-alanine-carboxypeptidase/D-alanyl-D-alanine-endopeptidase
MKLQQIEAHSLDLIKDGTHLGINFVLIGGQISTLKSLGKLKSKFSGVLTEDLIFEAGSLTKLFVGLIYSELFLSGSVGPGDRVDRFIPELKGTHSGEIELRELLTHTSGLPRLPVDLKYDNPFDPYAEYNLSDLEADLLSMNCSLRGEYLYSNLGYAILGIILERIQGSSLENCLNEHIFSKLSMSSSFLSNSDDRMVKMAQGHRKNFEVQEPWNMGIFQAAGALKSSILDLARFLEFCFDAGSDTMSNAFKLSSQVHFEDRNLRVGYGWHILPDGKLIHEGGTYGHRSLLVVSSQKQLGLAILANSCNNLDGFDKFLE